MRRGKDIVSALTNGMETVSSISPQYERETAVILAYLLKRCTRTAPTKCTRCNRLAPLIYDLETMIREKKKAEVVSYPVIVKY